jgi:hypothetical protein
LYAVVANFVTKMSASLVKEGVITM